MWPEYVTVVGGYQPTGNLVEQLRRRIEASISEPPSYHHHVARILCPWNSLGKNTEVGCHSFLQGLFLTQGSNPRVSSIAGR